ncbi:MAG: O-methyltransferase [Actinomycetota bacterium]
MGIDIVDPRIEDYLRHLVGGEHEVADAMEEAAGGFPIVGRVVGVTLEVLALSIGARRVLELGSGFGYSAYWFARAVGPGGEVHTTDTDPKMPARAAEYLGRAGLAGRVRAHVGEAVEVIDELDGEFDVIFNDIDKEGYPQAWRKARERIRVGGLYLCDNVLWAGRVAEGVPDDGPEGITEAVLEHNHAVAEDDRYRSTVVPTRDGVMVALRID